IRAFIFLHYILIWSLVCVHGGMFVEPSSPAVFSVAEGETRLPCQFKPSEESVVQVIWTKEKPDGTKEQIITAHHTEGQLESRDYAGRVRFEGTNPMANSALIIMNTKLADEGKYTCTISAFPTGSSDTQLSLTVWTQPISTLDTFILVEGQSFRQAATCRSMAKPQPGLSWDTDLPGQSQNRSLENGVSFIKFSLHPLRYMNGRKMDCLVWHPTLKSPRRYRSQVVVHYPPEAAIKGYDDNWYVGLEDVKLECDGEGNPKPDNFTWNRNDGGLPDGVTTEKGLLKFNRPLTLTDTGEYECVATNLVGSGRSHLKITVTELRQKKTSFDSLLLIIIGAVAVMVVIILVAVVLTVNRHYKRKNKQLTMELNEKKVEISTLSRQASIRRVGSINTEKYQMDEALPLRGEGTIRTSLSSLDHPRSRDSHSTLGGAVDMLGRPVIYNTSRRGRERMMEREREGDFTRLKVESFVKNSNLSLVHSESHFLPPLQPSPYLQHQTAEGIRSRNGSAILPAEGRPQSGGGSRTGSRMSSRNGSVVGKREHQSPPLSTSNYPMLTDEEEGDLGPVDEDSGVLGVPKEVDGLDNGGSETTSSQISEAMSNHFEHSNGILWPKSKPNSILLAPETTRLLPAHNGIIHHQPQIV
uniref:Ig-like domain-containing protein n=1 Tax=Pygocentrus nattereri TaxID=42514 RepID=A0A3B4CNX9_PYGNA